MHALKAPTVLHQDNIIQPRSERTCTAGAHVLLHDSSLHGVEQLGVLPQAEELGARSTSSEQRVLRTAGRAASFSFMFGGVHVPGAVPGGPFMWQFRMLCAAMEHDSEGISCAMMPTTRRARTTARIMPEPPAVAQARVRTRSDKEPHAHTSVKRYRVKASGTSMVDNTRGHSISPSSQHERTENKCGC